MGLVCACFKRGCFFLFLSTLYSRSEISFQGDLNTTQALSHSAMGCVTPRELLSRGNCGLTLSMLTPFQSIWSMKTVQPKMGNPSFTLLVLHLFAFIIWEDELTGWKFGFSELCGQKCNDCTSDQHTPEENTTNMPNSRRGLGHTMSATFFLSLNLSFYFSLSPKLG